MNGFMSRFDFENALNVFNQAFNSSEQINARGGRVINVVDEFLLTQTDIRLEQPLSTTNAQYTFPVMVNIQNGGQAQFNTETRLNNQDTFLPQYIGFFLANPSSTTDTTFRLSTWANPAVFTTAGAAAQMQGIYNGNLNIAINNRNYITKWGLWKHQVINQTQQTAPFGAGSPVDQLNGADDAYYPLQPYVLVSGSSNMQITVQLPAAPTTIEANSRLVMIMKGAMAYNSTVTT